MSYLINRNEKSTSKHVASFRQIDKTLLIKKK